MAGELSGGSLGLPQPTSLLGSGGGGGGSFGEVMQLLICVYNASPLVKLNEVFFFFLNF